MAGSRVVHWNGRDVPDELRELPAGSYVLEPVEAAHELTAEEDEGLRMAMASLRAGKGRSVDQVRHRLDAILRR
jgi:quercetin dioxygenase-like cupin family protein